MDTDGFLRIVDRKKGLILVSGFNVYPNEIEDVISQFDAVLEVAVIGVPDSATGEAVRAYVVPNPDHPGGLRPEDVIAHCKRQLTGYKIPRQIVVRDERPKTPVGEVLRKNLKAQVAAETPPPLRLALARGHRWLAMLESGEAKSLKEIAAAILDDALPSHITLFDLAIDPPTWWDGPRVRVNCSNRPCHALGSAGTAQCHRSNTRSSHPAWA